MKNIWYLCLLFVLVSCNKEPFFSNFDTIEHYQLNKNSYSHFQNQLIEKKDSTFIKIIQNDEFPLNIKDTTFITILDSDKFIKQNFSKEEIQTFKTLFNNKTFTQVYTTACEPLYRDILILKKQNKITGIVKICFECKMNYIVGNQNFNNVGGIEDVELEKFFKKSKLK